MKDRAQPERLWRTVAGVFVVSILVTVVFWMILPTTLQKNDNSDFISFYEPVARNILAGRWFKLADGNLATRYPPGYPLALAGIFALAHIMNIPEETALSGFTVLGVGLSSVFVFLVGKMVWGILPALISALLWMTCPFALWLTNQPNSEIPFVVVLYGSFYFFLRALFWRRRAWLTFLLSGFLVGVATLIRPIAIGASLVMGGTVWLAGWQTTARVRLSLITALLVGSIGAMFPWEAWVYSNTGNVVFLSTGGPSSMRDGLTFGVNPKRWRRRTRVPQDVAALMQDILSRSSETQSLGGIASIMVGELQTRPVTVIKLYAMKAARSWYGTNTGRLETPIILIQIVYLGLAVWGGRIAWRQEGAAKQLVISVWSMVLYFWGMTVLALSILRYMVPTMGLLFLLIPAVFLKRVSRD